MKTLAASLSILTREGVMLYLLRGVAFTCIISVLGVIMGLIVGSLLALARTYCKKGPARILGWFATAYIELFRNTPYLLWIFICVVFLKRLTTWLTIGGSITGMLWGRMM